MKLPDAVHPTWKASSTWQALRLQMGERHQLAAGMPHQDHQQPRLGPCGCIGSGSAECRTRPGCWTGWSTWPKSA
ncbi:hypothetical protein Y1Q_0020372 [Alligator mississippiensis]|uniref:Uncharacterized protein n=1 Tax=Alligator mississippiensis TaxID=8496 RepID=A0A151N6F4_ALLMI|nr:hypothetical protein Y1Q_0020372 [Alligator mississippiensis]